MIKIILLSSIILVTDICANFNFGECSGSGTFEQEIEHYNNDYENSVTVGSIPEGIQGLDIKLISENDVDIRLY
ncbi:MAG: Unknown protein [uncultured Sulfurovum sp.]|uniref:Uncharacterized protein n=1 Tax=uncultured Sulfurovum sp. TaxID=269237 RepID=A0A6S6RZT6_9BACT|nr:MAG: Unknown protein [uncultured Sulfurovum sp.]